MTVHHALFFFFLLSLQVRNCSSAEVLRKIYGAAGEDIRAQCGPFLSGSWKIFCRENCEGGNILIRTKQSKAQSGRYSTECGTEAPSGWFILYVSISGLTQSDPGRYRCGVGKSLSSASYQDFRLVLVDAVLDGNKDHHVYKEAGSSLTVACSFGSFGRTKSFSRGEPGEEEVLVQTDGVRGEGGRYSLEYDEQPSGGVLLVTITQLTQSDSGRYRCKMDRTGSTSLYRDFHVTFRAVDPSVSTPPTTIRSTSGSFTPSASSETTNVTQDDTATSKGASNHSVLMFVGLTLLIIAILISVVLLIFCTKRRDKHHKALRRRGTDGAMMENVVQENVSSQDPTYQSLSPAGGDQNQIYNTLTQPK
ncbi:polymeric immunoglobulin receptor-like isoform 1-T1 [Fundulus diaphanus]